LKNQFSNQRADAGSVPIAIGTAWHPSPRNHSAIILHFLDRLEMTTHRFFAFLCVILCVLFGKSINNF
jgi:hypothetical protein